MSNTNQLKYYSIVSLKYFAFIFFLIGGFLAYDGLNILIHANQYEDGLLKVDSLFAGPAGSGAGGELTSYAVGVVGNTNTNTTLMLGTTGTKYVDSIGHRFMNSNEVLIPVWFRGDGILTLRRNSDSKYFPFISILKNVCFYLLCFNGPFLSLWLVQRKLKKKYNLTFKKS